ncbi:hypothetical protein GGR52DRAFT_149740 [Hypoxylon sp. FL1284]|nr:hypothetical protein GGR52DRAFT_149740 [Hypoxylon sp. FL1284]
MNLVLDQQRPRPVRASPPSTSGHTRPLVKLVLTLLSVTSCIIVLAISIALATDSSIQSYIVVWTAPQAGAALWWSVTGLVSARTQPSKPDRTDADIHPGAHVAVHLLLSLGFGAGLGLTARILKFALAFTTLDDPEAYPEYYAYYYSNDDDGYEYYSNFYIRSMETLVAFLSLLIIIHFLLFVNACREVLKRDRTTSAEAVLEPQQARLPSKDKQKICMS